MIDPPRPEAVKAIEVAKRAGIRVGMITGDHPTTAAAIARELGIAGPGDRAITGAAIERMPDSELAELARTTTVYARVNPEHKLRIVRALKSHGEIVAKGAADMILVDDNFASIIAAIEEGRSIYANIQKFLRYLLSTNLGEVLVLFLGVVFAGLLGIVAGKGEVLVLPLLATMILWINLVTDGAPAIAVGLDPLDPTVMQRPPRDPRARVITPRMWYGIVLAAGVMCVGTLGLLDASLPGGQIPGEGDIAYARTLAFNTLVLFQLFAVFSIRSDEASAVRELFANAWLWASVALAAALQGLVLYVPTMQKAFGTVPLSAADWALCMVVASLVLVARELQKACWRMLDRRAARAAR